MKRYITLFCVFILAIACKKEEIPYFEGKPGIIFFIPYATPDSTVYSFAFSIEKKNVDTVFVNMWAMGAAADHPRKITVVAGAGTTARAGVDYELPEFYLPAGELTTRYPVILKRTPEMETTQFRLVLNIEENEDLRLGATGANKLNWVTRNFPAWKEFYVIRFDDILGEPPYWVKIKSTFGEFSVARYQFMVQVLGIADFSTIGNYETRNYPVILRRALAEYEAEHGPLVDENGNRVTF